MRQNFVKCLISQPGPAGKKYLVAADDALRPVCIKRVRRQVKCCTAKLFVILLISPRIRCDINSN